MTALSSSSTLTQVQAAFDDNADYDLVDSGGPTKAKAYIEAGRLLIRRLADDQSKGRERVRLTENIRAIKGEIDHALQWLRSHEDSVNTTYGDLSGARR